MFAEVIVDVYLSSYDKVFDYIVPDNMNITKGYRVLLPFGNRTMEGYVLKLKETTLIETKKIKSIIKPLDDYPIILPELLDMITNLKETYNLRLADIIKLFLPSQIRNRKIKPKIEKYVSFNEEKLAELSKIRSNAKNQIAIINYLRKTPKEKISLLNAKYGSSTVNSLIKSNFLNVIEQNLYRKPLENDYISDINLTLTTDQVNAINDILNNKNNFHLLFGVTGSGKTEVYMNVIDNALKLGKTAIMLVPEISLTPKTVKQFRARFGDCVAVLHSGLTDGEKFDEWNRLRSGQAQIAIGARSAIFAPLENIGAIIIDEEHDGSYQSESNPRYDTQYVAELRAKYNNCPLVMGSATPTIESFYKAKTGKYNLITLKNRVNNNPMPPIEIIDMTKEYRNGNKSIFSQNLIEELTKVVNNNQQAILFLNRRGFSSFLMCKECGYVAKCSDCDVSLVYHKEDNMLKCHYCGKKFKTLTQCPQCGNRELKLGNTGTEKVVQELKKMFPQTKILRMDNDTTNTKSAHAKILNEFENSKPAILVGTQMIAKGHDFPFVTLVGILDADLSLFFSDFKASEKTYQLITQVAGRAGRAELEGKVLLQTFFPKNYVYNLCVNYDYLKFYEKEINLRQTTEFPPFSKIIRILITADKEEDAKLETHKLFLKLKELRINNKNDFYFLEAMRSPLTKIKNKYRFQILLRIKDNMQLIKQIYNIAGNGDDKVLIFTEVNPQNLS